MKYYFITYQATNRQGSITIWNQVIDKSPMEFIKLKQNGSYIYNKIVVLNTYEISEKEFNEFKDCF